MNNTTKPYRRGVQIVRPFSHKEDALISQLRIDGHGTVVIAEAVFMECGVLRSQATINMRLKTLARREEEDEDLRARTAEHARRFPSTLVAMFPYLTEGPQTQTMVYCPFSGGSNHVGKYCVLWTHRRLSLAHRRGHWHRRAYSFVGGIWHE